MDRVNGYECPICFDTTNCENINLACRHTFGRSCMQEWLESTNKKKCVICQKELTDSDIKEINKIPLHKRKIIPSKIKFETFCRAILTYNPPVAASFTIGSALGAAAAGLTGVGFAFGTAVNAVNVVTALAGLTIGAFWTAAGPEVDGITAAATGITTGIATRIVFGTAGSVNLAVWSAVGAATGAANNYFEEDF